MPLTNGALESNERPSVVCHRPPEEVGTAVDLRLGRLAGLVLCQCGRGDLVMAPPVSYRMRQGVTMLCGGS